MNSLEDRATIQDSNDGLARFRDAFDIRDDLIYLDGNSLGRPPKQAAEDTQRVVVQEWTTELVMGWDHWLDLGQQIGDDLAPLLGASPGEVAVCDQTSINVYKLASAALADARAKNVLTDGGNFPSDLYVLEAVAKAQGGRVIVAPEDPTLDELETLMDDVGLVAITHVSYRSGAMYDGAAVTAMAHRHGARMMWDLAHSAGAVPVALNEWDADVAVGCTYKYLNGGPGSPAFVYVRSDLHDTLEQPIPGWFAHANQFSFDRTFVPAPSIRRFLIGTPSVVSMAAMRAGIELSREAGIDALREKSISLSELFVEAVDALDTAELKVASPRDPQRRGSHVTLGHDAGFQISSELRARGVVSDFRAPDLIRFGFAPLYNTHRQVVKAVSILGDIIKDRSYLARPAPDGGVT
ncbi:MAG: kynureninase [Acidimicrobiia bacterium]